MALEVSSQRLAQVLLDFGLAPGNFPVRLGEPRELYLQLNTVALWALGRIPDDIDGDAAALTEAARLFVRRACFAPDNTHYQVMALQPRAFTADELRSRYRSLIRLTHPDRGVPGLPGNAAGIVNRAHEILSDPLLRSQYDDQLGERKPVAMRAGHGGQRIRRIELSHGLGDRWHSVKARYPKLVRMVLSIGGISAVAVGLLIWAASDGQEGRMLVINGTDHRAQTSAEATSEASKRTAVVAADHTAVNPSTSSAALTRPADVPATPTPTGAVSSPVPPQPARPAQQPERSVASGQSTTSAPEARPKAADSAATIPVVVASASATGQPTKAVRLAAEASEPIRVAQPPPQRPSAPPQDDARTVQAPASTAAPTLSTGSMETERLAAATAPAVAATPAPVPSPARTTAAAAISAPPRWPAASNPPVAAPPAPASIPAPAPSRAPAAVAVAKAPPPAALPPHVVEAPAAASTVVHTDKTWDVDSVRAKHYLIELLSKLSDRAETKATNSYLASMNVTGSLFRPALTLMERYPEISVESLRWTDSEQPGILRMRGEIVLSARSPHQAPRSFNYGLSAEFWGTRAGTVLADLNLKERE